MTKDNNPIMIDIENFVNEISSKLSNEYSYLDNFTDELNNIINLAHSNLNNFSTIENNIKLSNNIIIDSYNNQIKKIEKEKTLNFSFIKSSSLYSVNRLQNLIDDEKNMTKSTLKQNNEEKLLTTSSTNPVISTHFRTRNSNIEINEKKIKKIVSSYDELVNKMTSFRDYRCLDISKKNNLFMNNYEIASNNVIKSLNDIILKYEQKINMIDNEIEKLKTSYNNDCLELEKRFNKEVVSYQQKLKEETSLLTKNYDNTRDLINEKLLEQQQKNQDDRSNVFKDFVQTIHKLNDKLDKLNQERENHLHSNTLIFHLKLFDYDKRIRFLKEQNSHSDDKLLIRNNNNEIKHIEKLKKTEAKALNLKTDAIKKFYKSHITNCSLNKNTSEDIKNKQIEKLDFISEIEDNAHHNKLATLQLKYDYDINKLNVQNERDIKQLRIFYDKEKIKISEEYKTNLTNLFIKKQYVLKDMDVVKNEMKLAKILNKQVTDNANLILSNELDNVSTKVLLEIEKNNSLKEYNIYYMEKEIDKEKALFDFLEQDEFLHRDKKNTSVDFASEKTKLTLAHNEIIYAYNIELETLKENYLYELQAKKHSALSTTAFANQTYTLFTNRKKQLISLYKANESIFAELIKAIKNLIQKTYTNKVTLNNKNYYINTLSTINTSFNKLLCDILEYNRNYSNGIINDQITHETGTKYENRFNSLKTEYNSKLEIINARKKDLQTTIDNYNNTSTLFYNNLGNIQSKYSSYEHQLRRGEITKFYFKKETFGLKSEAKRIHKLISINDSKVEKFQLELNKIPNTIEKINYEYNRHYQRIKNEQIDESSILFNGIESFDTIFNNAIYEIKTATSKITNDGNYIKFISKIEKIIKYYEHIISTTLLSFLASIETIDKNISKKYNKFINKNQSSYNNQIKIIKKNYFKNTFDINIKIENENNKFSDILKNHNENHENEMNKYNNLILENKKNYNDTINYYDELVKYKYNSFMTDTTSIRENILSNNHKYKMTNKYLINSNKNNNQEIVNRFIKNKDNIILSTKEKLKSYEISLNNIPYEAKLETKESEDILIDFIRSNDTNFKNIYSEYTNSVRVIENETKRYAASLQNKIGLCNNYISKGRKAITQRG